MTMADDGQLRGPLHCVELAWSIGWCIAPAYKCNTRSMNAVLPYSLWHAESRQVCHMMILTIEQVSLRSPQLFKSDRQGDQEPLPALPFEKHVVTACMTSTFTKKISLFRQEKYVYMQGNFFNSKCQILSICKINRKLVYKQMSPTTIIVNAIYCGSVSVVSYAP